MIISQTPFRISFFGGGTDYPDWYRENGGAVLATTIDKYCYITCRYLPPFFEHKHRLVYSLIENVKEIEEIQHPAVKAVLSVMGMTEGLEIHHDGDLPARSGIGSSSSFTVGLINALKALRGELITKADLATQAIYIEQEVIRESVGSQDQVSAAFGGFNRIEFLQNGSFGVNPVIIGRDRIQFLQNHMMLFFTGLSRFASEIAQTKISNLKNRTKELHAMRQMVDEAMGILQNDNIPLTEFGKLLHESWQYKRSLSHRVSNPQIDEMYEAARDAGAIGGKLLGAGGGGFILFFVEPQLQEQVRERLKHLLHVSFRFENTGSKIVLYEPAGFQR